jgi:hypothetical protein
MAGDTPEANRPSLGSFLLGKLDLESSALVRSLAASASASTFLGRSVGDASMARSVGEASMARPVGEKLVETQSIMSFHPPNLNISYSVAPDLDLGLFVASDAEEHDDRFTSDESSSIASSEEEDSQLVDANGLQSIDGFEVVAQTVPATPEVENPAAMGIARPRSSLRPDAQPFQITEDLFNAEMTVNGDAGKFYPPSSWSLAFFAVKVLAWFSTMFTTPNVNVNIRSTSSSRILWASRSKNRAAYDSSRLQWKLLS